MNRSLYYYHQTKPKLDHDLKLICEINKLRQLNPTIGSKKIAKILSDEERINHKRIARILKENNLVTRRKKRSRNRINNLERIPIPKNIESINTLWSIDFMCTRKINSFKFTLLNVIDIGTRVSPLMTIERSFTSVDVTDELEKAISAKGCPKGLVTDNGVEFTSTHFRLWCKRNGIIHHLTNKGSPSENCFVESFNSSVRREVLDANDFKSMNELRNKINKWREYYNKVRPHGSLNYESPENYIKLNQTMEMAV